MRHHIFRINGNAAQCKECESISHDILLRWTMDDWRQLYLFLPTFRKKKVGIVLLDSSEVGGESELSLRFEVSWVGKSHFPLFIYICTNFVQGTSLSVINRLTWNLDIMCKYNWSCAAQNFGKFGRVVFPLRKIF